MSALRSDYLIDKRRANESQLKNMFSYISKDNQINEKAKWENKTSVLVEKKDNDRKIKQMKEQREIFLDNKRRKLAKLLQDEEELYRKEIIDNQETPLQVRLKMEAKLKKLKEQREFERLELVKKLQERKFYADADELRKNDSEAFAIECYLEQENQMIDKLKKREQDRKEEEVYVKLNELDIKKRGEIEAKQAEEIRKKKEETYKFLEWQKQTQKNNEDKLKRLSELENERIKAQWEKDNANEFQEKIDKVVRNKEVYKNIQEFNRKEEDVKRFRSDIEKQNDKDLINAIVSKENALDDIDKKEKERKKQEFFQNKKYLEFIMNQKKEAEAWMDQIVKDEADKQWRKEQEAWMKQENARIELLKQVYREREDAVKYKKYVAQSERDSILKERIILDEEIRKYNEKLEEIKKEDALKRKSHQDDLIYQMKEKQYQKDIENQDKTYEERAAKLWEIDYQKKINEQRELHLSRLAEIKRRGMEEH